MKITILLIILIFAIMLAFTILSFVQILKESGLIQAICPTEGCNYDNPLPRGKVAIGFSDLYKGDELAYRVMLVHCQKVYPRPCSSKE